ncbi:enoyl-CoA hydratase-related protein [Sphingomonas immobilis]|uniref:Enoyl-CoA hydratase-related protein n=1 Tax=Sphingomonas immobilis TaxID=3063997 RepID=A0ABT9A3U9_9SPHN|nr:enoyl-CoA hydratase-related protein [Sphingomonas sp. CA1-15]MDO7843636.1 enoyl-CoA hydratase-related protein [Sphingomonas sp. CA1-15]
MAMVAAQGEAELLTQRVRDHVLLVTINRPNARNAVSPDVAKGLAAAIRQVDEDDDIWVAILTGAGDKAFCAGADLKAVAAGRTAELSTPENGFAGFVFADRKKPWIAAVNGPALGGGCELMLACDFSVIGDNVTIGLPEVHRSVMAGAGGMWRLPRAIPRAVAFEMIGLGIPIAAERALALDLVNRVVPQDQLIDEALAFAALVCKGSPVAVRESLRVARRAWDCTESELRDITSEARERLIRTQDYAEGPRAFVEKRPPQWTGR